MATYAIGDLQGCLDQFDALAARLPHGQRFIFVGDLVNRGPQSLATLRRVKQLTDAGRALTLLGSNNTAFTMSGGEAKTTFYPLGYFEGNQGLAGGSLIGDVEYRGAGLSRSSGTCSGFVDSGTCLSPGSDATPAPPYAWRD